MKLHREDIEKGIAAHFSANNYLNFYCYSFAIEGRLKGAHVLSSSFTSSLLLLCGWAFTSVLNSERNKILLNRKLMGIVELRGLWEKYWCRVDLKLLSLIFMTCTD